MKKLIIIMLIFSFYGCRSAFVSQLKNKYFTNYPDNEFTKMRLDTANYKIDSIKLDESYALYIRQICRKRPPQGYYDSHDPKMVADVIRCNCEEFSKQEDPERLEIQYLFYSQVKGITILITTIPPYVDKVAVDKTDKSDAALKQIYPQQPQGGIKLPLFTESIRINNYDEPLFKYHINYVNINYFNLFEFGRVCGNEIILNPSDKDVPDRIRFSITADGIFSFDNVYLSHYTPHNQAPAQIFANPVKFYLQKKWDIGLDNEPAVNSLDDRFNNYLENKTIYMVTNKTDESKMAIFHFNKAYSKNYYYCMFENARIKSY